MPRLPVIRTLKEAKAHDKTQPALVEVPAPLVQTVTWMLQFLESPGDDTGKVFRTLLRSKEKVS